MEEGRGTGVQRSRGPKDQDISNLHSNTSLTLKKVDLVLGLKSLTHGSHFSIGKVSLLFYSGRDIYLIILELDNITILQSRDENTILILAFCVKFSS